MTRSHLVRLAAVLAALLVFLPILGGQMLFYSDYSFIYHPLVHWSIEQLASGNGPWWNPGLGMGLPQFANPILGTFYPPNLLLLVLPFDWGLSALLYVHVAATTLAMMWLLRELRAEPFAQLTGGIAFALSGALISSTSYAFPVLGWAWVPVALVGVVRVGRGRGGEGLLGLALAMMVLAGSPLAALMSLGLALALLIGQRAPRSSARGVALGAMLGTGLAAIQIVPTLMFLPDSVRAGGADAAQGIWSLAPQRLVGFVLHDFWGRWGPELTFWGEHLSDGRNDGNFFFFSHYLGMGTFVLAAVAVGCKAVRGMALALWTAAAVALLLSLGRHTPIWGLTVEWIPGFGLFRYPEKWLLPATLAIALGAGLGLQQISEQPTDTRARLVGWVLCGLGVSLGLLVLILDETLRETIATHALADYHDAARDAQVAGAWRLILVSSLSGLGLWAWGRWRWVAPAFACLVLLDLATASRGLLWPGPPEVLQGAKAIVEKAGQGSEEAPLFARHPDLDRVRLHRDLNGLIDVYRMNAATLRANFALQVGGRVVHAESPARIDHPLPPDEWMWTRPGAAASLLGVSHLLTPRGMRLPGIRTVGQLPPLGIDVGMPIRALPGPAICIGAALPVKRSEVRDAVVHNDPLRVATLEPSTASVDRDKGWLEALSHAPGGAWPCAQLKGDTLNVKTKRRALLVIRRAFSRGWSASSDGEDLPIFRAYGSLQAIPLEPGEHRIHLRYEPPGLLLGAGLSICTLLALLLVAMRRRRGRRPTQETG